jgi:hypothetical protein
MSILQWDDDDAAILFIAMPSCDSNKSLQHPYITAHLEVLYMYIAERPLQCIYCYKTLRRIPPPWLDGAGPTIRILL